jgi:hypothetical protein
MKEVTHTPGPWTAEDSDGLYVRPADVTANVICDIVGRTGDGKANDQTDEDLANAQLIAAAPDLLAACRLSLSEDGRQGDGTMWSQTVRSIRAAIDKATTPAH